MVFRARARRGGGHQVFQTLIWLLSWSLILFFSRDLRFITFSRSKVRISSYTDGTIRTVVEAWADTKPVLA